MALATALDWAQYVGTVFLFSLALWAIVNREGDG